MLAAIRRAVATWNKTLGLAFIVVDHRIVGGCCCSCWKYASGSSEMERTLRRRSIRGARDLRWLRRRRHETHLTTLQQCMETARGMGSLCQPNTQYVPPPGTRPPTRVQGSKAY